MTPIILDTPFGKYRWLEDWAVIPNRGSEQNGRTHGVAVTREGNILVFHQAMPAMLVFGPDGRLLDNWGHYPGAHGLTLVEEDGREFCWVTDEELAIIEKTTVTGTVVARLPAPAYSHKEPYVPTWVAVNERRHGGNGDIWVADGYGSNRVLRYDADGNHIATLNGESGAGRFECPHGLWFDVRKRPMPLYIADRSNRRVQVYDSNSHYLYSFGQNFLSSPDGFSTHLGSLIIPELDGSLTILNANDDLVCRLGLIETSARTPLWPNENKLQPGMFNSPHAAAWDATGNLYVVEWRIGGRIVKLENQSHASRPER